jgi:hypothetical protein
LSNWRLSARRNLERKRDPTGHVPRFDFPFGRALAFQFLAPFLNYSIEPIQSLISREAMANGQGEQLSLKESARITLVPCSLHAGRERVKAAKFEDLERHRPILKPSRPGGNPGYLLIPHLFS